MENKRIECFSTDFFAGFGLKIKETSSTNVEEKKFNPFTAAEELALSFQERKKCEKDNVKNKCPICKPKKASG